MQREIEFRAWDKENKVMEIFGLPHNPEIFFKYDLNTDLMQFTGLLDKNGKKIFEGDILKIYYQNNQKSYLKEVKWLNDISNKGRWDALDNCAYTSCEVVGNIFENPELLEG
jgi:hypothetical protein